MSDETATLATSINEWMGRGRAIADRRRAEDWALADWMEEGKRAGFLNHVKFGFVSESLGVATRRLKDALKAATTFPPRLRQSHLSVEHHTAIASLPRDEAQQLLQRAADERLPVNALRQHVTQRRYETGQNFKDEDVASSLATLQIRAWNRATPEAREMAFEHFQIAARNGLGIIDEDEVVHG